jgi:quinol monooxygenase YgiN
MAPGVSCSAGPTDSWAPSCTATAPGRFLTIDRWRDEQAWQAFLTVFRPDYETLDARLEGIAAAERSLFEGSS